MVGDDVLAGLLAGGLLLALRLAGVSWGWWISTRSTWRGRSIAAGWALGVVLVGCGGGPAAPVDRTWSEPDATRTSSSAQAADTVWQEHFRQMPSDFESPSGHDGETIARVYAVGTDDDGSPLLQARHDAVPRAGYRSPPAVHFGRPFREGPHPLSKSCVLSWRWRVHQHPAVTDDPWLDVAGSVYVMINPPGLLTRGQGFKFGWLSKAGPRGSDQRGLLQVELRHDPASPSWHEETVDLCRLYRQAYGDPSEERILYVGVVTDADNTASVAAADYADFRLRSRR